MCLVHLLNVLSVKDVFSVICFVTRIDQLVVPDQLAGDRTLDVTTRTDDFSKRVGENFAIFVRQRRYIAES